MNCLLGASLPQTLTQTHFLLQIYTGCAIKAADAAALAEEASTPHPENSGTGSSSSGTDWEPEMTEEESLKQLSMSGVFVV